MNGKDQSSCLWLGTAGSRDSPLFKDPEQLRRKFRAWMWPHDFEVKYIEFWPDFTWGTIGMESSAACAVLLEHAKQHPFKPEGGKVWEVKKYKDNCNSGTESSLDPVFQNLLATNDKLKSLATDANQTAAAAPKKPKVVDNIIKASESKPQPVMCDSGTSPTPPPEVAESPRTAKKKAKRKSRHKSGSESGSHVSRSRPSSRPVEDLLLREIGGSPRSTASSPNFDSPTKPPKKKKHRSKDRKSKLKKAHTIHVGGDDEGILDIEDPVTPEPSPVPEDDPDIIVEKVIESPSKQRSVFAALPLKIEQQIILEKARLKEQLEKDLKQVEEKTEEPLTVDDVPEPFDLKRDKFVNAVNNLKKFYQWNNKDKPKEAEIKFQELLKALKAAQDDRRQVLYRSLDDASNAIADKTSESSKNPEKESEDVQRASNIYISYLNDPTVTKADFVQECAVLEPALNELTPIGPSDANPDYDDVLNLPDDQTSSVVTELPTVLFGGYATVAQIESLMLEQQRDSVASTNIELEDDLVTETGTIVGYEKPEKLESLVVMFTEDLGKISKAFQAPKSLDRWYALETWLKIHYFDRHKELASLYARWVICVLAAAGQTPVGLEADLEVHMVHGLDKFCSEMADTLEKYLKQTEDALGILQNEVVSISTIIHSSLCYLIAKHFPAFSVPRPLNRILQSIPYSTSRTCSLYQTRGIVVRYFNPHLGLIQSPKGCAFFGPANVTVGTEGDAESENVLLDLEKRLPKGSFVLFDASCYIDQFQSKKLLYMVASRVANQNVRLEAEHKEAFYSLPLINNGGEAYMRSLRRQCCKEVHENPEKYRPVLDVITTTQTTPKTSAKTKKVLSKFPEINQTTTSATIYSGELNKLCENLENNDILDFTVRSETNSTFDSLVAHFKSKLQTTEIKGEEANRQAQERERMYLANHYAAVWIRMGYDLEQLEEDFHTLYALGSWGCVMFSWENLFTRYHLPYCVDLTRLLNMTGEFIAKTDVGSRFPAKYRIDNPDTLLAVVEKRAEHEKHYMIVKSLSKTKQGRFSKDVSLLHSLHKKRTVQDDDPSVVEVMMNGNMSGSFRRDKEVDHVKIKPPNSDEILSFETDKDGNLSLEKVSVFIKGVLALKYKMSDNVWRIVSMEFDVLQKPQDGWGHRVYIPITSSLQHHCKSSKSS